MALEHRYKMTFTCHDGLFRVPRMPFGLKNTPGTFYRPIGIIISTVRCKYWLIDLKDIIVFTTSNLDHLDHVREVLKLLQAARMTLRLIKCFFMPQLVDYLGHVIYPGKLAVAIRTLDAFAVLKPPRTLSHLWYFLDFCNVYRRFVTDDDRRSGLLTCLLGKVEPVRFVALSACAEAVLFCLKLLLISSPVWAMLRYGRPYVLDTDA